MIGIKKFKVEKGNKISTYVSWWIRQEIQKAIENEGNIIRIPSKKYKIFSQYRNYFIKYFVEYKEEPTVEKMAEIMGISLEYSVIFHNLARNMESLNKRVIEESSVEMLELLESETPSPEEVCMDKSLIDAIYSIIAGDELNEREKIILIYRYELFGVEKKSRPIIGKMFNISGERVRIIENNALIKLKELLETKGLAEVYNLTK